MRRFVGHRRLVIGATVLAFAAAGGGAYAATQSSSTNPQQAFLNDVAKRLHVSPQKLAAAIKGATADRLNAAVKAGRLTPAQAKALKQHLGQIGPPPFFGGPFLARPFFFPPGGPGRLLGPPAFFPGPFAGAASYLGVSEQQLFTQLRSGRTLAQVAKAHGKSVSGLQKAMTAAVKSRLDQAVAGKSLTKAQEQKMLTALRSRIDALVNGKPLQLAPWRGGPPRPLGMPAPGLKAPGSLRLAPAAPIPVPGT